MAVEAAVDLVQARVDPVEAGGVLAVAHVQFGAQIGVVVVFHLVADLGRALEQHAADD